MTTKINADVIIVGDGDSFNNGSVVVDGSKIIYAGEREHAPAADTELETPVLMPGMWDVHGHYTGTYKAALEEGFHNRPEVMALRCVRDVSATLHAGFTSVREMGGMGIYLKDAIQEGIFPGPRIYAAGNIISPTGGHGDIHNVPLEVYHLQHSVSGLLGCLADGVPEVLKAVRMQLRKGAEIIKYCSSGGVMSQIDDPVHQQFSLEEQKALVGEAGRADCAVAAHCHGAPGIRSAIEAGVTSIEHGSYLDEELADMMIERGTIYVPTRYVVHKLNLNARKVGMPEYAIAKIEAIDARHLESMQLAIKKGVKIATGTDIFVTGANSLFSWGENALELKLLVDAGMKPMDAIVASTGNAPLTLGRRAPKSGMLKEGYDADIILMKNNPLEDISRVIDNSNFNSIMKQGVLV